MTLQECYAALGGNYDDVLGRLHSERLVQKFVLCCCAPSRPMTARRRSAPRTPSKACART